MYFDITVKYTSELKNYYFQIMKKVIVFGYLQTTYWIHYIFCYSY